MHILEDSKEALERWRPRVEDDLVRTVMIGVSEDSQTDMIELTYDLEGVETHGERCRAVAGKARSHPRATQLVPKVENAKMIGFVRRLHMT